MFIPELGKHNVCAHMSKQKPTELLQRFQCATSNAFISVQVMWPYAIHSVNHAKISSIKERIIIWILSQYFSFSPVWIGFARFKYSTQNFAKVKNKYQVQYRRELLMQCCILVLSASVQNKTVICGSRLIIHMLSDSVHIWM